MSNSTKTITISGDHENDPVIKDVITRVNIIVRFDCEDKSNVKIIFSMPISKFIDEDRIYTKEFHKIFIHYLKQSTMFLQGSTQDQRRSIEMPSK